MSFAIQPGAAEKATWDMSRSRFEKKWQYAIQAGVNIINEGTWLARTAGADGGEVVLPCTGAANEVFAGVSQQSGIQGYVWANCIHATIPAVPDALGNYDIDVGHLGLVNDEATPATAYTFVAFTATPTTAFTINNATTAPGGTGIVQVVPATGIYRFNVADAGLEVKIVYRWELSAREHDFFVRDSHINRGSEALLSEIMVGCGAPCIVYTMMYDAAGLWIAHSAAAGNQPCLGANGEVTTITINAVGTAVGRVIKIPSVDDPYLGIEFSTL